MSLPLKRAMQHAMISRHDACTRDLEDLSVKPPRLQKVVLLITQDAILSFASECLLQIGPLKEAPQSFPYDASQLYGR